MLVVNFGLLCEILLNLQELFIRTSAVVFWFVRQLLNFGLYADCCLVFQSATSMCLGQKEKAIIV